MFDAPTLRLVDGGVVHLGHAVGQHVHARAGRLVADHLALVLSGDVHLVGHVARGRAELDVEAGVGSRR